MGLKNAYRAVISHLEDRPQRIEIFKTKVAETISINRKKALIKDINWTADKQREFDDYWTEVYGKKIPNYWHKLYEALSGKYSVDYIPEKLYTTRIEPSLNNPKYAKVFEDKNLIQTLIAGCPCISAGSIVTGCESGLFNSEKECISLEEAISIIKSKKHILFKPTSGSSSGNGIVFIDNPDELSNQELEKMIGSLGENFVVQSRIIPHKDFAAFNEDSINTIRIITYLTNGGVHHVPIALRMGRKNSNVDNIHAGGIGVGVNDDGSLCEFGYELGYGNKVNKLSEHPDSHVVFKDYVLPKIPEIIEAAYSVHKKLVNIGIVSWDFTVDENANVVLIEANIRGQGIWFNQIVNGKGAFGEDTKEILSMIK